MLTIRSETNSDHVAIHEVHCMAFPTDAEARLVERLRKKGCAVISYVAELDGEVIGHILYSPVSVDVSPREVRGLGLAPLSVLPSRQKSGVGSALIRESLKECKRLGYDFVVVLGEVDYYPKFGFCKASEHGLGNEYGADEAFMVLELTSDSLAKMGGTVRFDNEFAEWS